VNRALRLALLTEIPAPYRIPLFNALADRVELRVLFLAERDPRRGFYELHRDEWRFDHRVLRGRSLRRGGRWLVLNRGVLRELRRFRPDAVGVGGWNQPAFWLALAYCKLRRIPLLVWIESTAREERSGARTLAIARAAMARAGAGAFVPGTASAEYARSLGIELVETAPNAVDAGVFDVERRPHDGCVFLYVGRLDPEKAVDRLLEALAGVPAELLVVGSGSEEASLRARATRLADVAGVKATFLGAIDRDELSRVYAGADVLVLPSLSEPWGMVLNEGATAGLALVATDACGGAFDLIEEGRNGFRVPAGDTAALHDALLVLAEDPERRAQFGSRSREIAARFTPEAWADGVVRLASSALAGGDEKRSPTR
jgi:glycosyltransferase involved in cell wall biosynthesis